MEDKRRSARLARRTMEPLDPYKFNTPLSSVSVEKQEVKDDNRDTFQNTAIREGPLNDSDSKELEASNRGVANRVNKSAEAVPLSSDAQNKPIFGSSPLIPEKRDPAKEIRPPKRSTVKRLTIETLKQMEHITAEIREKMAASRVKKVLEIKQQYADPANKNSNCKRSQVTALADPPSSKLLKPSTDNGHKDETSRAIDDKKNSSGQTDHSHSRTGYSDDGTRSGTCSTSTKPSTVSKLSPIPFKNPNFHLYQVEPTGQRPFIPRHTASQDEHMQHSDKREIYQQSAKTADKITPERPPPIRGPRPPMAHHQRHGAPTAATGFRPDQIRPACPSPRVGYQDNFHPKRSPKLHSHVFGDTGFHFPETNTNSRQGQVVAFSHNRMTEDDKSGEHALNDVKKTRWMKPSPLDKPNESASGETPGETLGQRQAVLAERTVAVAPRVGIATRSVPTPAAPLLYATPGCQSEIPPAVTHQACEISHSPSIQIADISGSRHELWQRSNNAEPDTSQIHYRFDCFDSAAILSHPKLYRNLDNVVKRSRAAGVQRIISLGFNLDSCERNLVASRTYPDSVSAAIGIHPHAAHSWTERTLETLGRLVCNSSCPVVAIGECGLDYYHNYSTPDMQMEVFDRQVGLACNIQKPLIVHERKAHSDLLKILDNYGPTLPPVVIHCFSGGLTQVRAYVSRGYYIGITGSIARHQKTDHRHCFLCLGELPLDKILIESTAPYMFTVCQTAVKDMQVPLTPETRDLINCVGDKNEPCTLPLVVEQVAACLHQKPEHVAMLTMENAKTFYQL